MKEKRKNKKINKALPIKTLKVERKPKIPGGSIQELKSFVKLAFLFS